DVDDGVVDRIGRAELGWRRREDGAGEDGLGAARAGVLALAQVHAGVVTAHARDVAAAAGVDPAAAAAVDRPAAAVADGAAVLAGGLGAGGGHATGRRRRLGAAAHVRDAVAAAGAAGRAVAALELATAPVADRAAVLPV